MPDGHSILLSALPPSHAQKWLAATIALVLFVALLVTIPFAQVQLPPMRPFIPIVDTILFLNDLITAALLFAQFSVTRSRALLALACGYLFTALVIVPHGLTFPDVFSPTGLLGANLQSTVWLYIFWHLGLPPAVIVYALLKGGDRDPPAARGGARRVIATSIAATTALVCTLTWLVTAGTSILPPIMVDAAHASSVWHTFGAPPLLVLSVTAIALLGWRRSSVLDLWLLVVLWAWFIETLLLSTTAYRYSLVWYAGRAYGILSSFLVLLVLLSESTLLYARLAVSAAARNREREARLMTMDALAASMAHEINQPLGAIVTNSEAGMTLLEKSPPDFGELRHVLGDISKDGERAGEIIASIRSIFRAGPKAKVLVDIDEVIRDAVAILHAELETHGIALQLNLAAGSGAPPARILADRGQIQQVILNLAANAIDAMAGVVGRTRTLKIVSKAGGSEGVVVSVIDTGSGIDPMVASRIFDAFVTTKPQGTGMGLAICRSLVAKHGGRLWLSSEGSPGAAFSFSLPGEQPAA